MIEPIFNEFSTQPLCADDAIADVRFKDLVELIHHLEKYGIKRVRYEKSIGDVPFTLQGSLGDYCNNIRNNRSTQNASKKNDVYYLYSKIKPPFVKEGEQPYPDNLEKAQYIDSTSDSVIAEDPVSLVLAHFLKSFTIGFDNNVKSPLKLRLTFTKNVDGMKTERYTKDVYLICVTNKNTCLDNSSFVDLLASQDDLPVPPPTDKKNSFTLPKHHGNKECQTHGAELLNTPYVKDILSTIQFDGGASEYIAKVNPDGSIEVRLYWTKKGYGLLISTSGQDIVQTTWIAKQLDKQYGKGK